MSCAEGNIFGEHEKESFAYCKISMALVLGTDLRRSAVNRENRVAERIEPRRIPAKHMYGDER